jgi:hypothetical protein
MPLPKPSIPLRDNLNYILWLLFIASRIAILLWAAGKSSDLFVHRDYVEKVIHGQIPYRDFVAEYPPLTFAYTLLPALFDSSLGAYFPVFRLLTCVVDFLIFATLVRNNRKYPSQCLLYIVCTGALGSLLYDRIDLILGAILLAGLVALSKERKHFFQWVVGLGIAFKLIPIVLVPLIAVNAWRKSSTDCFRSIARLFLPTIISFGVILGLGGTQVIRFFEYHSKRGVQLESTAASLAMVVANVGPSIKVSHGYGSWNLDTQFDGLLKIAGTLVVLASGLIPAYWAWRYKLSTAAIGHCVVAVLLGSMIGSKVLSPQYFLFVLPLLCFVVPPDDRLSRNSMWILTAVVFLLTGIIFPWYYDDLVKLDTGMQWLLIERNFAFAILALEHFWRTWSICKSCGEQAHIP